MVDGARMPVLASCSSGVITTASRAGPSVVGLLCPSSLPVCVAALLAAMSFLKSFPPPGPAEGLRQQQPDTEAVLNGKGLGTGTLYIAESRLSWLDGSGLGFSLEYPTISLHAVSRDLNAYPREHLYVMVNAKFGEESKESVADEEEEDSDDDVEPITEFRFVPSDKSALEAMFTAMCECQALHPDPEDEDSDDYDGDEYDVEAHDGMEVDTAPTVAGQFEDADVDH
ncbi:methylosome subunit pICln isoform X2 [Microcebus murinus]|uniref:methylosome subunit pICln isoform X2 n=1 Tax=Microcebus murinus TaxID=30608 RepID=UPI003F6C6655